jgi:hypothetical protein
MQTTRMGDLVAMQHKGLTLTQPYGQIVGDVWPGFLYLVWGPKGGGKSTFCMGLAKAYVPHAIAQGGTVMYFSGEEGPGPGLQKRALRLGLDADPYADPFVIVGHRFSGMQGLKRTINENDAKVLVVDSYSVLDLYADNITDFLEWCREREITVVLIGHAYKDGSDYKGNSMIGHAVDAELKIYRDEDTGEHLVETRKNRAMDSLPPDRTFPGSAAEIGPAPDLDTVMRENPNCSQSPQSDQCKAIFASLQEQDKYDADRAPESPSDSPTNDDAEDEESTPGNEGSPETGTPQASEQEDTQEEEQSQEEDEPKSIGDQLNELAALMESAIE